MCTILDYAGFLSFPSRNASTDMKCMCQQQLSIMSLNVIYSSFLGINIRVKVELCCETNIIASPNPIYPKM